MTNAHRDLPGFRYFADLLIGEPPEQRLTMRTRTLEGFTGPLESDIISSLGRTHLRLLGGGRVLVHIDRIVRDDYRGNAVMFWAEIEKACSPSAKRTPHVPAKEKLIHLLGDLPDNGARKHLLELVQADRGWPVRVLRRVGVNAAFDQIHTVVVAADQLQLPLPAPTTLKDFGSRLFQDSHRLDPGSTGHGRLADYLLTQTLVEVDAGDPDWRRRVYEHYNLFQNTMETTVLVAGDLHLAFSDKVDTRVLDNTKRGLATSITLEELTQLQVGHPKPRLVVSIENGSPFTNLLRDPIPGLVLIYTAGYGNAAVSQLLSTMREAGIPYYHWGDVDVGGLRALHRLQLLANAKPLLMDAEAVNQCKAWLTPFVGNKRKHVQENRDRFAPNLQAALQACLDLDDWLEQESIPPDFVKARLMQLFETPQRPIERLA